MRINLFISLLLMLVGVMASVPSCWTPTYLGNISAYSFISGMQDYNTTAYSNSYTSGNVSWGATALADMGATGMSFIRAQQYQDTSRNRGFMAMFYDTTHSNHYFVVQWTRADGALSIIRAIPALQPLTYSNVTIWVTDTAFTYYNTAPTNLHNELITADDGEMSYVRAGEGNSAGAFGAIDIIKLGTGTNTSFTCREDNTPTLANHTFTTEGLINYSAACGAWVATFNLNFYYGNSSTGSGEMTDNGVHAFLHKTIPVGAFSFVSSMNSELNSYYSCGVNTGNVTFFALAGSSLCSTSENVPYVNCTIDGDTVDIDNTTATSVTQNTTIPIFHDVQKITSASGQAWYVSPFDMVGYGGGIYLYKDDTHKSQLTILPLASQGYSTQACYPQQAAAGTTATVQRECINSYGAGTSNIPDTYKAMIVRYDSPTGNVNNTAGIYFDTTMNLGEPYAQKCESLSVLGSHNYNMTLIVGVNETHYKRTRYLCTDGVASTAAVAYSSNVGTLLDNSFANATVGALEVKYADFAPVWIDQEANTVNRFIYFQLLQNPTHWQLQNGEALVGDNENFRMNVSYSVGVVATKTSGNYAYGTYFYSCNPNVASGYSCSGNCSGYITIDAPTVPVVLTLQKAIPMFLNITVTDQLSPAQGAVCITSGQYAVADVNGVCHFTNIQPDTNYTVRITHNQKTQTAVFETSDYYNSQGLSCAQACASFQDDATYKYYIDVGAEARESVSIVDRSTGNAVQNALVYWDGTLIGKAQTGTLGFSVPWNYTDHTLQVTHPSYVTYDETVTLSGQQSACKPSGGSFRIELIPGQNASSGSGLGPGYNPNAPQSFDSFTAILSSGLFIAVIAVIGSGMYGLSFGGALGGLGMMAGSAFLFTFLGLLPFEVFMVLFASFLVTLTLRGVRTIS